MKIIKKIILIASLFIGISFIVYGGIYLYAWMNPKLILNNANSYYFYDNEENLISGNDDWVTFDNINPNIINATIAIEDRHFFDHIGFDYLRIAKALYTNITTKEKRSGASTITQQYAKNLFLTFDKTWKRKITEAWLTIRLEVHYSKEQILEGYLNTINYGGVYGIENASQYYFGKDSKDLSLAEASILAGIPNLPSEYSPLVNYENSKKRQMIVLKAMDRDGYIDDTKLNQAYNQELIFVKSDERNTSRTVNYYKDAVKKELQSISSIPSSLLATGGLKIYTNFDVKAQDAIESTIKEKANSEMQAATIIMEPSTGKVLGLTGGIDYSNSQFNRATSSNRSVGSTIKPFLYYSALENNFTASTTFTSEKTTFVFSENETYSPTNFGDTYPNKKIALAAAIAYSDNIYAVKTHLFLGENALVETMKRVGVNNLDSIPSLALGSQPISLLDMTKAYSALANEGYRIEPYFISRVEDVNGNVLYEKRESKEPVLNKNVTFILSELLANATNQNLISYTYPTGYSIASKLTKKYAIKTGTTEYDHMIFGYNKDVVVGMWSGYDDNRVIGSNETSLNKEMWASIIEKYTEDKQDSWYSIPNNVVGVMVDAVSGEIANTETKNGTILYYIKGTEPTANYNLDEVIPTMKPEE